MNTTADHIAIIMLFTLLILTCYFLSTEQGISTRSWQTKISNLETRLDDLRPVPRIEIGRGTVYAGGGSIVVEDVE